MLFLDSSILGIFIFLFYFVISFVFSFSVLVLLTDFKKKVITSAVFLFYIFERCFIFNWDLIKTFWVIATNPHLLNYFFVGLRFIIPHNFLLTQMSQRFCDVPDIQRSYLFHTNLFIHLLVNNIDISLSYLELNIVYYNYWTCLSPTHFRANAFFPFFPYMRRTGV